MSSDPLAPFRLKPWFSPRPWGRRGLSPWYSNSEVNTSEPIGEAWLTGPASIIESGPLAALTLASVAAAHAPELLGAMPATSGGSAEFPLLVKLLFPADKLSVQVHPDDAHAQAMGQPRGKTECWYVLSAEPGATIALGLKRGATSDSVRAAIAAGTLEDLLNWVPVTAGDMIFVDAGTVHAIGPGMVLLETQQTCDITFRMYDYGRPRELHVDQALHVMKTQTAAGKVVPQKIRRGPSLEFTRLIEQQYFTVDRYDIEPNTSVIIPSDNPGCLVPLTGSATLVSSASRTGVEGASNNPKGSVDLVLGHAIIIPANGSSVILNSATAISFVHCWAP